MDRWKKTLISVREVNKSDGMTSDPYSTIQTRIHEGQCTYGKACVNIVAALHLINRNL